MFELNYARVGLAEVMRKALDQQTADQEAR
jgi:hypothetical protein